MKNLNTPEPKLAPPGAGLPFPARLMVRWIVGPYLAGKGERAEMSKSFTRGHEKVREVYLSIPENLRDQKVLVPSQRGLEDSSRYWSAAMVLEHLEIVGRGIAGVIVPLSNGVVPNQEVSTALVKPFGKSSPPERFDSFEKFRASLIPELDSKIKDFESPTTLPHPWFGPMTARKWYWLLGMHTGIHFKQMKAIRSGL